ncbi:tRNA (adenosine(37)-N6)-dimethylallyltransferase MiaA [Vagococcus humatus]|uniref:tRNA dimethylallyltransferase n=1 Tax=Vagococcus humatus TaxID=1889241 RepID=A0A429Z792_9ENTE|nr:tRNA (adenosine(37)-N6)-dimethylallyltransferase MiaA [Vagococcus humatus]
MSYLREKVLVIVGPTAVGKTSLSIELAQLFQGEIISGDSLQVYEDLNIGTAKVTEEEQQGVPHFLIDVRKKEENYSAYDFQQTGRQLIHDIKERGHLPIVVGGTGLYIQSLLYPFDLGGTPSLEAEELREELELFEKEQGKEALWQRLKEVDELASANIHPNNVKRVIRAIQVKTLTGNSLLNQTGPDIRQLSEALYDVKLIGLTTDREVLYQRINERVDIMMTEGLLEEAKLLKNTRDYQSAQGIGYKEFFPYFDGQISLEEAIQQVKQNSRRYAKRQLTWFRNRMTVEWWDILSSDEQRQALVESVATWLDIPESRK